MTTKAKVRNPVTTKAKVAALIALLLVAVTLLGAPIFVALGGAALLLAVPVALWFFYGIRAFQLPASIDLGRLELSLAFGPWLAVTGTALAVTIAIALLASLAGVVTAARSPVQSRALSTPRVTRRMPRTVLVASQVAITLVLVAGAEETMSASRGVEQLVEVVLGLELRSLLETAALAFIWLASRRDLGWRKRRLAMAIGGTAMAFTVTLLLTGVLEGIDLEARRTLSSLGADAYLLNESASGPFTSLDDFCQRVDLRALNKRVIESLVKCGAMDDFGPRERVLAALEGCLAAAQHLIRLRAPETARRARPGRTDDDERHRFKALVSFRRTDDLEFRVEDWFRLCREYLSGPVFAGLGEPRHRGWNWGVEFRGEVDLGSMTFPPGMSLQYSSMVPGPIPLGPYESAVPLGEVDVSVWMEEFPFGKFICEASSDNLSAADVAVHLRDLVADHVSRFRVGYGAVTNSVTGVGDPPLEPALRRSYVDGLYQSEQVLRG